ncbi:5,10-methylenetetrahydromethanopterin reductase [Candidatus Bathyarchaeota archaeon]|nr:5,10-methylenetetrahydromethanopterin reductase [Candidatus Bathyarchaeota archaeon]
MVKFGIEFVPNDVYWKTVWYAIQAEDLGFDNLWITDHFNNRNVYTTLAVTASFTERISLGPGVTNPYLIHPAVTAQAIASLSEIAPGRVVCGIGAGDRTTLQYLNIYQKEPLAAIREAIAIIRALTSGTSLELKGKVFDLSKGAKLNFKALNPIPIYIGAQGSKMLMLAGEIGDGVLINASSPKDVEEALLHVRAGALKSGRSLEDLDVAAYTSFSVAEDGKQAKSAAIPVVAFIVAGCPSRVLEHHGLSPQDGDLIRSFLSQGKFKDAFSRVTDEMIEAFSISGTPEECIEKMERLLRIGVTQFVVGSPIGRNVRRAIEIVGKEIIPRFKA